MKQNRDKIADLYIDQGYYLATVDWEVRPVNEAEVDVWFTVEERSKVEIRGVEFIGNAAITDDELRNSIATRKGGALSFLSSGGTFNEKDQAVLKQTYDALIAENDAGFARLDAKLEEAKKL